jgi:hypothetical protein
VPSAASTITAVLGLLLLLVLKLLLWPVLLGLRSPLLLHMLLSGVL